MNRLSLHIGSEISLKDFSFSQLIIVVKALFDTEGIPGLVKVLVILINRENAFEFRRRLPPLQMQEAPPSQQS